MKRLSLMVVSAMMSISLFAQEDVTHYISNAGFDQDLTWQADGSKKEIIDTKNLSDRSIAAIAADSTVYATVNPSTPKSRGDGRTLEATNGFIGRIQGWQIETNQTFPKCEWVYFGSLPYALGATAIPVADDGSTYITVPEKPAEAAGADNLGFAYMRAGWGGRAVYKQTVKLPCAKYRLEYWAVNLNPSGTKGKNLSKVTCRKDTWNDETGFSDTEWTKHIIEFTPTAEFSMEFGFESEGGSGSNPFLCLDGIKLYKIGEADRAELLAADINDLAEECDELSKTASGAGYVGLASELTDYSMEISDMTSSGDADEMEAFLAEANARMVQIRAAIEEMKKIDAVLAKMDNLLKNTNYAGKEAFDAAYLKILGYKQNEPAEDVDVVAQLLGAVAEANAAIKAYYLSQEASETNPADYTIFVQHPWFINEEAEPVLVDGVWEFPLRYDAETGEDRYVEGSASSPDLNAGGWTNNGIKDGDHRLNWQRGRSCWNAWYSNFTGVVSVGQTITDLPNGYYTVSADLITQSGCATDQHVYAQSTSDKKISTATLTEEGWDESVWQNVSMTADDKVLVVDGKLTIGAEGTGSGNGSAGWFCATNFKLYYLGAASDADVKAAVKATYDAKLAEAMEYADAMHLAADKKTLNDSINKCTDINGDPAVDYMLNSIEVLNAALTEAKNSEAKYVSYFPTQETLDENPDIVKDKVMLWVKALLDGQEVDGREAFGVSAPIAQYAYDYVMGWVASAEATYTKMDATVELLNNYVNSYAPVYRTADEVAAASKETGKKILQDMMASHVATLTAQMQTKTVVDALVKELNAAVATVKKQNIYEDADASDYTAYISNPNAEAIDGWDIVLGNGDGNGQKSGQWFDGSNTRYFDSYHSQDVNNDETGETTHIGLIGFKASQLVKDLPNGTYKVGVYTRTPAEGAYIFAGVTDTTFVEIPLSYYNDEATGEQVIASDKFGPIWEEAKTAVENDNYTDLQYSIYNANGAQGRGWKHQEIEDVVVTNHELFIGTMCGTAASKTAKVFDGNWYSVGGWTLTLVTKGDNAGWEGPVAGVDTVETEKNVANGIYTITGVKVSKLQRGMNIVVRNGKAQKILVK